MVRASTGIPGSGGRDNGRGWRATPRGEVCEIQGRAGPRVARGGVVGSLGHPNVSLGGVMDGGRLC